MAEYTVGQIVAVCDHYGGPASITKVEKITHGGKRVVTADGQEWKANGGSRWGSSSSYYTGQRIYPAKDGDADLIKRKALMARIIKFGERMEAHRRVGKQPPHSTEALERICEAIAEAEREVPSSPTQGE